MKRIILSSISPQVSPGSLVPGQVVRDMTDMDKTPRTVRRVDRDRNYYTVTFDDGTSGNYDQWDKFEVVYDTPEPQKGVEPSKKEYVVYAKDEEQSGYRQLYWRRSGGARWSNEADADKFTEAEADAICRKTSGKHIWVKKKVRV